MTTHFMKYCNQEVAQVFNRAADYAFIDKRYYYTVQHVFLTLLKSGLVEKKLTDLGVDIVSVRESILKDLKSSADYVPEGIDLSDEKQSQPSPIVELLLKKISEFFISKEKELNPKKNPQNQKNCLVNIEDLAVIFFLFQKEDLEEHKPFLFIQQQVYTNSKKQSEMDYPQFVCELISSFNKDISKQLEKSREEDTSQNNEQEDKKQDFKVTDFLENLNILYRENKLNTNIVGREKELLEVIKVLSRKKKNNPIILGEVGVGKNSIIDKLVHSIETEQLKNTVLEHSTVWSLNIAKLVSGTKYRGDFEKRMSALIDELKKNPANILIIDNIQQIIHSGSSGGQQGLDVAGLLIPALNNDYFKCIGITSYEDYNKSFVKEKTLSSKFQKIIIKEPTKEETLNILQHLAPSYEEHHSIKFSQPILEAIIELTGKYIHSRHFPDKALDVLDEIGALYSSKQKTGSKATIEDVLDVVSQQANIVLKEEKEQMKQIKNLDKILSSKIFGQEEAVKQVYEHVLMAKAGLCNPKKPFASFLFLGPTGTGKTEITVQLSEILGMKLHRFDMSEYMEKHTVSKFIGSPPGYVGYDKGGLLTETIEKEPYSILLLDEVEKAHKDIFNTLLQVLDNGFLTDASGKSVSFRNTIIIMTSNAGAADLEKKNIGFNTPDNSKVDATVIKNFFAPEFRNRLSCIINFNHLSTDIISKVVDKFIFDLENQLKDKNIHITLNKNAKEFLISKGYDKNMGARPMERAINDYIKKPLSKEILFGTLTKGGKVKVDCIDNELKFNFQKN